MERDLFCGRDDLQAQDYIDMWEEYKSIEAPRCSQMKRHLEIEAKQKRLCKIDDDEPNLDLGEFATVRDSDARLEHKQVIELLEGDYEEQNEDGDNDKGEPELYAAIEKKYMSYSEDQRQQELDTSRLKYAQYLEAFDEFKRSYTLRQPKEELLASKYQKPTRNLIYLIILFQF